MAQLVERSLLKPEVSSSNPVISKSLFYIEHLFTVNCVLKTRKLRKRGQGWPIKKNHATNLHPDKLKWEVNCNRCKFVLSSSLRISDQSWRKPVTAKGVLVSSDCQASHWLCFCSGIGQSVCSPWSCLHSSSLETVAKASLSVCFSFFRSKTDFFVFFFFL